MKRTIGYRLDQKHEDGNWFERTSLKKPYPDLAMPLALATDLNRIGETWRIVETSDKAKSADQFMRIIRSNDPSYGVPAL